MKRKVIPIILCGAIAMTQVQSFAAWTTTNPTTSTNSTTSQNTHSNVFSDIGGHWAQRFIEQWANNGVFGGMGNGTFSPNTSLTRAQFASVIMQIFNLQMLTEEDYGDYTIPKDVPKSHWGAKFIAACLDNGVMNLRGGMFAPDQPITREEVFYSLGKAAKLDHVSGVSNAIGRFTDANAVSPAARDIIGKMTAMGMLAGRGNGMLEPRATITRAEVSTILTQVVDFVMDSKVKGHSYSNAVVFSVDNGKDLELSNVKVNGNIFIKGKNIGNVTLTNVSVKNGAIYIYANNVDQITVEGIEDTEFIVVSNDVTVKSDKDSDENTYLFANAKEVDFSGCASKINVEGDFISDVSVNGNTGNGIDILSINGKEADNMNIKLSGTLDEVDISGNANITGYGLVKSMYLDDGNYSTTMAPNRLKIMSGKLKLAGREYTKGTYDRSELPGAVIPNISSSDTPSNGNSYLTTHTYQLNTNQIPTMYFNKNKVLDYIKMDNNFVQPSNYSVDKQNAFVQMQSWYLNTLTVGTHDVKFYFTDGTELSLLLQVTNGVTTSDYTFVRGSNVSPSMYVNNLGSSAYTVMIDTYTLSNTEYTVSNGHLAISTSRLNSLTTGVHNVTCYSSNGTKVTMTLRIIDAPVSNLVTPNTVHHTRGVNYTTQHTYTSPYNPNYITMDGSVLSADMYILNTTNKTFTLKSNYVNTLSAGNHTMRVYFADGRYDDVFIIIKDESQITSYIFDKTPYSTYYKNVNVGGISTQPTLVMVDDRVMPTAYYGYNSATQEVVLYKEFLASLNTGEHRFVISYGNTSRTVNVVVQQSTDNATFVHDKNIASANHRDLTLTGNISNSNLKVFVKNRELLPSEYSYSSGSVTIYKHVLDTFDIGTCYIGVQSSTGNISAIVNITDTTVSAS